MSFAQSCKVLTVEASRSTIVAVSSCFNARTSSWDAPEVSSAQLTAEIMTVLSEMETYGPDPWEVVDKALPESSIAQNMKEYLHYKYD